MNIDISQFTEEELYSLNHQIVERLRFLQRMKTQTQMLEFNVGDRVSFQPAGRDMQAGVLVRYNKKTVSIITDAGQQWNVSLSLLRKVVDIAPFGKGQTSPHNALKPMHE